MYETEEACANPIAYTGEKVKYKGGSYPEVYIPKDIFPMTFSDTNTYMHQNKLKYMDEYLKMYYPEYKLKAIPDKSGDFPRFIELRYWE